MLKILAIAFLNLILCSNSKALVTYYFTSVLSNDIGEFSSGTYISGKFSYDSNQSYENLITVTPARATINFDEFFATVGSETLLAGATQPHIKVTETGIMEINRNPIFGNVIQINGIYYGFGVTLTDINTQNINLLSIPSDQLRLSNLSSAYFSLATYEPFNSGNFYGYNKISESQSSLTSLVPEPSALSLLAVGLGGLAMMRRRRS